MKHPNIIILHTDQQRYNSLGCNGNPYAVTPNIDALAKDSVVFDRHISTSTVCMPSRASLLTGMTVQGHGVTHNGVPLWRKTRDDIGEKNFQSMRKLNNIEFPFHIPTIAHILREKGYSTTGFGKFHLEPHLAMLKHNFIESYCVWENKDLSNWHGPFYGFQKIKMILQHGENACRKDRGHYGQWLHKKHPDIAKKILSGKYATHSMGRGNMVYFSPIPVKLHNTIWLADQSSKYIRSQKNKKDPFLLFAGFPDPHTPFCPPAEVGEQFLDTKTPEATPREALKERPQYVRENMQKRQMSDKILKQAARNTAAMVHLIDQAVGKIISTLKEEGLYKNTIIVFTSDHGDYLGDFGAYRKNNCGNNALLHIPFILKAPGLKAGRNKKPMSNADVLPTLLDLAGFDIPAYMQGVNIFQPPLDHRPVAANYSVDHLLSNYTLYTRQYRYTYYPNIQGEELYNHDADPLEKKNLVKLGGKNMRNICRKLRRELLEKHVSLDYRNYNRYSLW